MFKYILKLDDKIIGSFETEQDAWKEMLIYIKEELHFITYYQRVWKEGNVTTIDYGSHIHFFYIEEEEICKN